MRSNSTNVRCIGVQCPPPHESHDKRVRAIHREYDERIQTLPKAPDTRLRANWSFALASNCAGKCRRCGVDSVDAEPQTHVAREGNSESESPAEIWGNMSQLLSLARRAGRPTLLNDELAKAIEAVKGTALEFVFRLWIGDNHRVESEWDEAIETYRSIAKEAAGSKIFGFPIMPRALEYLAHCHEHRGEVNAAVDALETVTRTPDPNTSLAFTWFKIGTLLENDRQFERAKRAYVTAAGASEPRPIPNSNWRDLAVRAIARMDGDKSVYFQDGRELVRKLKRALKKADARELRSLASTTHFHVGGAACDGWMTEGTAYLDAIIADAMASPDITVFDNEFECCGEKQGLLSHGWRGTTFAGPLFLFVERCAYGWAWTGVAVSQANSSLTKLHQQQFGIVGKVGNTPLQLAIKAPWPSTPQDFAAGGMAGFVVTTLQAFTGGAVLLLAILLAIAPPLVAGLIAAGAGIAAILLAVLDYFIHLATSQNIDLNFALGLLLGATVFGWFFLIPAAAASPCGFGVRGFYYQDPLSHTKFPFNIDSEFAIDFTRNSPWVPFADSARNELVLAVADGVIVATAFLNPADSKIPNFAEIIHIAREQFGELKQILLRNEPLGGVSRSRISGLLGARSPERLQIQDLIARRRPGTRARVASAQVSLDAPTQLARGVGRARLPPNPRETIYGDNLPSDGPRDPDGPPTTTPRRVRPDPAAHVDPSTLTFTGDPRGPGFHVEPGELEPLLADPDSPTTPITTPIDDSIAEVPEIPEFGRYSSRYMHMQPGNFVSLFQFVRQGSPIARIGSTGVSLVPHLHFEMHDSMEPLVGSMDPLGPSVRPSPMDVDVRGVAQWLDDGDNGRCVHSTNRPDLTPPEFFDS